jgi:RNA polymerase sigma-70 factor (ECF subfamily)
VVAKNTSLKLVAKTKRFQLTDDPEKMLSESLKTQNVQKSDDRFLTPKCKDDLICEDNPCSLLLSSERTEVRKKAILKTIAKLPVRLRKLIKLRFFNQLSYAEIAKKTNLSSGNVGFLLNRATTLLRNKLRNDYGKLK